jgi:hypothetical protein
MNQLTDRAREALNLIEEKDLQTFTARELGASPQTLASLARKGYLIKIDGSSPARYKKSTEVKEGVRMASTSSNRYSQYKTVIENRVVLRVGKEAPEGYEYMATLAGKYIEIVKYDLSGKQFPKVDAIFLDRPVDDTEAFQSAWNDVMKFHLEVM